MDTGISAYATEYLADVRTLLDRFPRAQLERVTGELLAAHGRGSRIYIMGNGGSAATASHFACDLAKGCSVGGRAGFRVSSLTDAVPTLTAIANDLAYEELFREQLRTSSNRATWSSRSRRPAIPPTWVTHLIAQHLAQHLRHTESPSAGNRANPQRS